MMNKVFPKCYSCGDEFDEDVELLKDEDGNLYCSDCFEHNLTYTQSRKEEDLEGKG